MNHSRLYGRHARLILAMLLLLPCAACRRSSPADANAPPSPDAQAHEHGHAHEHAHDHHDAHAGDLSAAVARIDRLLQSVEDHFAEGTPAKADDALHELGELTERLPGLAAETDLPETEWTKVRESASRLFEQLDKIHAEFHTEGSITLDYRSFKSAIDAERSALAAVVAQLPALKVGEVVDDAAQGEGTATSPQ